MYIDDFCLYSNNFPWQINKISFPTTFHHFLVKFPFQTIFVPGASKSTPNYWTKLILHIFRTNNFLYYECGPAMKKALTCASVQWKRVHFIT